MYSVFNMGIGFMLIVDKGDVDTVLANNSDAQIIGEVTNSGEITFK